MQSFEFNVAPEYKKSFVDYTTIEKKIDDKKINYNICYDDGSDVEDSVEEEINKIIEEGDFYDLEDYHNYTVVETKYEIHGDLDIYNINFWNYNINL